MGKPRKSSITTLETKFNNANQLQKILLWLAAEHIATHAMTKPPASHQRLASQQPNHIGFFKRKK